MGNKNSNQNKDEKRSTSKSYYENIPRMTDKLYYDIWNVKQTSDSENIKIFEDSSKGTFLPYFSDSIFETENKPNILVSDNPAYIELDVCVCRGQIKPKFETEKYAVHHNMPDHECKGNCYCIEFNDCECTRKTVGISDIYESEKRKSEKKSKIGTPYIIPPYPNLSMHQKMSIDILSDTSPYPIPIVEATSSTSPYPPMKKSVQTILSDTSPYPVPNIGPTSPTSPYPPMSKSPSNILSDTSPNPVPDIGSTSPTSPYPPLPITKSSQTITSDTSPYPVSDQGPTSPTSPFQPIETSNKFINNNRNNLRIMPLHKLMTGGKDEKKKDIQKMKNLSDTDKKIWSTTSETSETSTISTTSDKSNDKKKKELKEENDEDIEDDDLIDEDDEDEDLEEIEDEEITDNEDGFEQSDISSSDLYKMQKRIFQSETTDNFDDLSQSTEDTTERVREAMNRMQSRNNIFDSEDREILDIETSTEKYLKKPIKKNNKYQ